MKILYISRADVSMTSGPSVNERQFIVSLYKLIGNKAKFLVPFPTGTMPDDMPLEQLSLFRSSKGRRPHLWFLQQFSLVTKANRLIKENDFDMIIIRADIFEFALNFIVGKNKIPYALKTAGSGEFKVFQQKNILIRSLFGINNKLYGRLIQYAILVDVVSETQRDKLREITGIKDKIVWIDNGVDIDRFVPMDSQQLKSELNLSRFSHIIGYAGNYPWDRGAMQMIKALPRLKEKYPHIGVVVLGDGSEMKLLYKEAEKLKVSKHCVFTGNVPFEEVVKYINCMDVCVSQRYEDTQAASELKVRQYLACGKPVVVTPGANDFVEVEGLGSVVDPLDEIGFFNAVNSFLSLDKEKYQEVATKARVYSEENLSYTSKIMERLELYKEILNG